MTILDFYKAKKEKRKISMVTCYDYWSAKVVDQSQIDCVLVGDSLAMVMAGHPTTLQATTEIMAYHTAAVMRGITSKFVVSDMPFGSFRKGMIEGMNAAETLMRTGCHAVKIEGARGNLELISHLVESGIPVMGHLGLTPQSIHQLGGFKVQAREDEAKRQLLADAKAMQEAGCFSLVLECVPASIAQEITETLDIIVIGIGAGPDTDGQVLVLQDVLGFNQGFKPKFLRQYLKGAELMTEALNHYHNDVAEKAFPNEKESYQS